MSDRYTYRITQSAEDGEHVGLCAEFRSLSWLAPTPQDALAGVRRLVSDCVSDMGANGETVPEPMADRSTVVDSWFGCRRKCTTPWRFGLRRRASA